MFHQTPLFFAGLEGVASHHKITQMITWKAKGNGGNSDVDNANNEGRPREYAEYVLTVS